MLYSSDLYIIIIAIIKNGAKLLMSYLYVHFVFVNKSIVLFNGLLKRILHEIKLASAGKFLNNY